MASSGRDERRRGSFREYVRSIVSERFVFVDGCSTNIPLSQIYARVPKGQRAHGKVPRNWGKNISLICAIGASGVKPSMSVEPAVDSEAFEIYVKHFLVPKLKRGQIDEPLHALALVHRQVVHHHGGGGCGLLFLPPYSPDMNPIEQAFSKVKGILRKAKAQTREALVEATGRALEAITPQDISGFYADCGNRTPVQSL